MLIQIAYIVLNGILFYCLSFLIPKKVAWPIRPIIGYSVFILWINLSYRLGLPILYGYILTVIVSLYLVKRIDVDDLRNIYPIFATIIGFIILCTIGTETYHAAQGHGYDRYSYMVASEVAKNYSYPEIIMSFKDLFGFGNNTLLIQDYLVSRSMGDYTTRPAASFTFTATTSPFSAYQFQLGSAFENLQKLLLILTTIGIGERYLKSSKLIIFLGIIIGLSYWTQYSKDTNAWSMFMMMPFLLLFIDNIIAQKHIGFIEYLLITTCLLVYPEGTLFIIGGTSIVLIYILDLKGKYIKFFTKNIFILLLIILILWIINPYIFLHIKRAFDHTGQFSLTDAAYNIRDIICYSCNYSDLASYSNFIKNFSVNVAWKIDYFFLEIPLYLLGIFGYISIEKFIGQFIFLFFLILLYFFTNKEVFKFNKNLILFIVNLLILQIILFVNEKFYGWTRAVNYTAILINIYFILILLRNINIKIGSFLLMTFLLLIINFQYGYLKNIIGNTNSFSNYFKYTWMQDSITWPHINGKYLDTFNYDSKRIVNAVTKCTLVDIQIKDKWLNAYFELLLNDKKINYQKKLHMTGVWDGHELPAKIYLNKPDCRLEDISYKNRVAVDLVFLPNNLSILRGNISKSH